MATRSIPRGQQTTSVSPAIARQMGSENMTEVLYSSREIRNDIRGLFRVPSPRRVAIVAFVGEGAEAYLPNPSGLELVCWPKAGGTNPRTLRQLIRRGVKVSLARSVHMKVYWSQAAGCIITSANLSTFALGAGNLMEAGARFPPGAVDIEQFLHPLKAKPVTGKDLADLDRKHNRHASQNPSTHTGRADSFEEWYTSPYRIAWKIVQWESRKEQDSSALKAAAKAEGLRSPHTNLGLERFEQQHLQADDWLFVAKNTGQGASAPFWFYVDCILKISKNDSGYDPDWPFEGVQFRPNKYYPSPPFRIDAAFRQALRTITSSMRWAFSTLEPGKQLLADLLQEYLNVRNALSRQTQV